MSEDFKQLLIWEENFWFQPLGRGRFIGEHQQWQHQRWSVIWQKKKKEEEEEILKPTQLDAVIEISDALYLTVLFERVFAT